MSARVPGRTSPTLDCSGVDANRQGMSALFRLQQTHRQLPLERRWRILEEDSEENVKETRGRYQTWTGRWRDEYRPGWYNLSNNTLISHVMAMLGLLISSPAP